MAPSRKRKAAAAAAARRQWKVGELVLAKLKGFPAWPATISEPEKWGFRSDRKKVLVLFFGTQQIAFCNPVDVEAFTEEKKQSLLKRQGRGADFVRAVKEIVDSYEKSKKQDEVYGSNSGYEDAIPDGGNSAESAAHVMVKEAAETSEATVTGKSIITTYTAKRRMGALQPGKQVKQRSGLVIDKSSISSCSESLKHLEMSFKDSSKCPGNVSTDVIQNGCLRRSRHSRKSPNTSECDDVDSSGFVMTGSTEENGSEILPADSTSLSLSDGCTIDSDCKPDCSEAAIESWDGDIESKGLEFQINAVVVKRKRKLSRKRPTNEAAEILGRLERDMEVVGPNNRANEAETAYRNFDETYNKDDGDEHLPLVKRARVRMSKLSSFDEHDIPSQDELTCKEVAVNMQDQQYSSCEVVEGTNIEAAVFKSETTNPSAIGQDDCPAYKSSFSSQEVLPLNTCQSFPDEIEILRTKESEAFGNSADGEAALPPTKRLHRALEAMSANVTKDGEACESLTMKTSVCGCSVFPMTSPSNFATKNEDRYGSGEKTSDSDKVSTFCSSSDVILEDSIMAPVVLEVCNRAMESKEHCRNVSWDTMEHNGGDDFNEPCLNSQVVGASPDIIQVNVTHDLDRRRTNLPTDLGSSEQSHQIDEKKHTGTLSTDLADENVYREVDVSELSESTPSLISQGCEAGKDISGSGINLLKCIRVDTGLPNAGGSRSQIGDNSQADGEHDIMTENRNEGRHKEVSYVSFSGRHVADKDALAFHSTLFPTDAVETPRRASPTTASLCQVSTSESANDVHNSGCSSPSTHLNYKKSVCSSLTDEEKIESAIPQLPKYTGKWGSFAELPAALASFEAVLESLTRTKESIARATRIAVDCAKFGASSEVIEILARNLEKESSLHKRIDLFFLVDSIAQCSRGSKGDFGGMYPSAIQPALPRLLSAAAPPGSVAHENRRQCLKVLRLWLERKILPESVIRQHMRELDALGGSSSAGPYSRRSARRERSLDDPIRDMEGMLVDEYGSNSSLQLAGLCMPRMLKDEGEEEEEEESDSYGEGFEAVTPEHNSGTPQDQETSLATEKHTRFLEDVDGELEMEDAAPSEAQIRSTSGSAGVSAAQNLYSQSLQSFPLPFAPLVLQEMPPSCPPLPSSPPPALPPLPPPPPLPPAAPASCLVSDSYANGPDVIPYPVSQNAQEEFRPSGVQQSDPQKIHQCMSNAEQYHAPECRDRMQMQLCDSTGSSSGSFASSQDYGVEHFGGPRFHHKAHHPRPPHPPSSDHSAYMQPRLYGKSRRETPPPPYSRRSWHNADSGSFYSSHERMRLAPYEFEEGWRHHMPHFHGPHHPDNKPFHPPVPYGGPLWEPARLPHQGWAYSPRGMHHRDYPPFRPSSEAQCIWRPR